MAFRENLLHLRAANNMTQEQLAMLVGVSRQSVAKWESGKAYPEMDKLIKLSQIFNCSLDELVQGDLTDRAADENVTKTDTPQDLFGYDEFMRKFANRISNGVMFVILGVAFATLCFSISDSVSSIQTSDLLSAFGVVLVLSGIVCGLINFIPAGLDHSTFVKEHPFLEDFYTPAEKQKAREAFSSKLLAGIICIFIGVCLVVFLSMTTRSEVYGPFGLLILVACGVRLIVNGSMNLSRTNIAAYNMAAQEKVSREYVVTSNSEGYPIAEMPPRMKKDVRMGSICGIVMILATIAGLVMLFVPAYHTDLFWLAWPIGGLLCAIITLLFKAVSGEE